MENFHINSATSVKQLRTKLLNNKIISLSVYLPKSKNLLRDAQNSLSRVIATSNEKRAKDENKRKRNQKEMKMRR